ncbi:MAG TPA: hypothetical protein PKG51_11255 [Arachnia sp.]|nr:hypothetical protein [Arachnia sp.]
MRDLRARLDRIERNAPKPRAALVFHQVGDEPPDLAPGAVVVPLFGDDDPLGPGAVPEEYEERDDDEEATP